MENVGRLVGRHLLHQVRGLLGVNALEDRRLHSGRYLGQSLGGSLLVQRLDDRLLFIPAQFLEDVRDVGGVQFTQAIVGNAQPQPAGRVRLN